jgi:5-methylcytosine-specific restriction endonuclease McrA
MIAHHVGEFGWMCPGDGPEHPAHPSRDLTCDHIVPLEDGGAAFDPDNTRILCKSWNSALGARLVNAKRAGTHRPSLPAILGERAQIRARFLA